MKKLSLLALTVLLSGVGFAQSPTGAPPTNQNNVNLTARSAWYRGGNFVGGPAGANNIFGTMAGFDSPIYTYTNGAFRMMVNATRSTTATNNASSTINTTGFIGINTQDPYSRLHIAAPGANQSGGWRNFMREGLLLHKSNDLFWFGLTPVPGLFEAHNSEIVWSDDPAGAGPDDMVFRFSTSTSDANAPTLQVMRYTNQNNHNNRIGNIGIGPLWDNFNLRPASLLHLHRDGNQQTWYQVGNQNGTGNTDNDGLKLGVQQVNYNSGLNTTNGYLRWQENTPFIVQTDWDNAPGFGAGNGERMRITAIGALTADANYNGLNGPVNTTRVAISHDGGDPVLRPMSLLHLGYDVGGGLVPGNTDGWRPWMDVGTFTAFDSDNMYVGLKAEGNDRQDAVINWGDNQVPGTNPNGPDNLRFIFTSTTTAFPPGQGDPVSQSANGLEVARMEPGLATTLPNTNFGMMGIGNFSPGSPNIVAGNPVDAKLDIDGDLRVRSVDQDDNLTQVLVIDPNDLNRVKWRNANTLGGGTVVGANNGTSLDPTQTIVQLGQANSGTGALNGGQLLNNREIPTNGFNITLPGGGTPQQDQVIFGSIPAIAPGNPGKVNVWNDAERFGFFAASVANPQGLPVITAIQGEALGVGTQSNMGVRGIAQTPGSPINIGVRGLAQNGATFSLAGDFDVVNSTSPNNYGIITEVNTTNVLATSNNTGVVARVVTPNGANLNIGGDFSAQGATTSYGIRASGTDAAAWFNGDVFINGTMVTPSDQMLKTNVNDITNASSILNQLQPKTFDYDTASYGHLGLPGDIQYGLIAQEVETILPELVDMATSPAEIDSNGNVVVPSMNFKSLEYDAFVPLLIQGFKEQSEQLDNQQNELSDKDSVINDLSARLAQLEECINNLGLCNNSSMQQETGASDQETGSELEIELSDAQNIILEQNVPNPFAEQTTIVYEIPENVKRAQILFYNNSGKLINSVEIEERGKNKMNVFANDLSSGVYTYTLVADGQIVDTKKMVKQR